MANAFVVFVLMAQQVTNAMKTAVLIVLPVTLANTLVLTISAFLAHAPMESLVITAMKMVQRIVPVATTRAILPTRARACNALVVMGLQIRIVFKMVVNLAVLALTVTILLMAAMRMSCSRGCAYLAYANMEFLEMGAQKTTQNIVLAAMKKGTSCMIISAYTALV